MVHTSMCIQYTWYTVFNIINLPHQNMNISFLEKIQLSMKATSAIYFFPKSGDFFNIIHYIKWQIISSYIKSRNKINWDFINMISHLKFHANFFSIFKVINLSKLTVNKRMMIDPVLIAFRPQCQLTQQRSQLTQFLQQMWQKDTQFHKVSTSISCTHIVHYIYVYSTLILYHCIMFLQIFILSFHHYTININVVATISV